MKAMILAAGRGERLRPLTDHTPKPLLQAGGRALIERTLESLVRAGFGEIVVNTAYLGRQIRERLGDGRTFDARIHYSDEGDSALETAGGIRQALDLLGPDPFLVVNGDIGTDYDFARLRSAPSGQAHLVLVPNPPHHPQGDFGLDSGQVVPSPVASHAYTFAGIGVYRAELFASLQPGRARLAPLLLDAMASARVSGEIHAGYWLDIGTPERLESYDGWLRAHR